MKLFYCFIIFILVGCNYKNHCQRVDLEVPKKFDNVKDGKISLANWWTNFEDEDLNFLIKEGINKNYDVKIALESIERARAYYRLKRANLFPEIDMTAEAIRKKDSKNLVSSATPRVKSFFQAGFDALWEIDVFGKLRDEKKSAFYDVKAELESFKGVYVSITSEIGKTYVDIRYLQNLLQISLEDKNVQLEILKLTNSLFMSGLINEIYVEQEKKILKEIEENIFLINTDLKVAIHKLAILIGRFPEDNEKFLNRKNEKVPSLKEAIFYGLPSDLIRNRPDIRREENILKREFFNVKVAFKEFFPTFSLIGNMGFESNKVHKFINTSSFNWSLGSILKWPIITFGRLRSNLDIKRSDQRKAVLNYENIVLKAFEEVENSFVSYFNEKEILKKIEKELLFVQRKNDLYQERYKSGIDSFILSLKEKRKILEVRKKEILSQRNLSVDAISIYKALGGGDWN